jgi:hypothetical protein
VEVVPVPVLVISGILLTFHPIQLVRFVFFHLKVPVPYMMTNIGDTPDTDLAEYPANLKSWIPDIRPDFLLKI